MRRTTCGESAAAAAAAATATAVAAAAAAEAAAWDAGSPGKPAGELPTCWVLPGRRRMLSCRRISPRADVWSLLAAAQLQLLILAVRACAAGSQPRPALLIRPLLLLAAAQALRNAGAAHVDAQLLCLPVQEQQVGCPLPHRNSSWHTRRLLLIIL